MPAYGLQVSCCNRPNQKQAGLGGRVVAEGGGGGTLADSTFRLSLVVVVHNKVCPCESSLVLSPAGMSMSMFTWPLNMQVSPEWFWTCCDAIKHLVTLQKKGGTEEAVPACKRCVQAFPAEAFSIVHVHLPIMPTSTHTKSRGQVAAGLVTVLSCISRKLVWAHSK